jgi:DNA-binding GntR family transcriptional regulator
LTEISGQPAYQQIAHDLRRKIADGIYPIGDPIPPTSQLMSLYHGSITVVRAAIKELQAEGVLIGQPGKGVYVHRKPSDGELSRKADNHIRLLELEAEVRELSQRLESGMSADLAEIRSQIGIMQSQIMELYGRMGMPYSHAVPIPAKIRKAKSA